jgi:hypothetical protein
MRFPRFPLERIMNRTLIVPAACGVLVSFAASAADADLQALRTEIAQMKQAYEQRIAALEGRLAQAESATERVAAQASPAVRGNSGANTFNPEIGLTLQGRYHRADGDGHITGFLPAGHADGGGKGLSLDHTELTLGGSIDPNFRGFAIFAVKEGEVETEEAWVQSTALGHGFTVKGGRFLSGIGYINERHPHAWDFADQNLAYRAMLGEHYGQDGLQFKWLAPTPFFLEFGVEIGQGANWQDRKDPRSRSFFAKVGGDIGTSHSWRAGLSRLDVRASEREGHWYDDNDVEAETLFGGRSRYAIADFVWKWAPDGNAKYRNFKFQAEYLKRDETGDLECEDNSADGGACGGGGIADAYRARQSGWYAQGVYQFHPNWRVGYRHDRLDVGSIDFGAGFAGVLSQPTFTPKRDTLMVDYNPSEFSRLRLQFARDRAEQGRTDHQVTLQYIHTLGAHGAHRF